MRIELAAPRSRVKHSTTEPLSSLQVWYEILQISLVWVEGFDVGQGEYEIPQILWYGWSV